MNGQIITHTMTNVIGAIMKKINQIMILLYVIVIADDVDAYQDFSNFKDERIYLWLVFADSMMEKMLNCFCFV